MAIDPVNIPSIADVSPGESLNSATNGGHANLHNVTKQLATDAATVVNAILEKLGVEDRVLGLLENDNSIPSADAERVQIYNRGDNLEIRMPSGEVFLLVHNTGGLYVPPSATKVLPLQILTTPITLRSGTTPPQIGTTETELFTHAFAANELLTGDLLELVVTGFETGPSNQARRIRVRLGPTASALTSRTVLLDTGSITNNNARTNWSFGFEYPLQIYIVSGGSSGVVRPYGTLTWSFNNAFVNRDALNSAGETSNLVTQTEDVPAIGNIDLSAACTLSVTVEYGGTATGYSFGLRQGRLTRIRM